MTYGRPAAELILRHVLRFDRDERADRRVRPDFRGGCERQLDAAEALRRAERGAVEGVERVAAVEVADPLDPRVVVVGAVGVRAAHRAVGDVLEHRERAEFGFGAGDAGVPGRGEDRVPSCQSVSISGTSRCT